MVSRESMRLYSFFKVGNHEFMHVKQFKYLESILTEKTKLKSK